jgi:hypothetical protein
VFPFGRFGLIFSVNDLSNLELVEFQVSFFSDIITLKLEFLVLNEFLFVLCLLDEFFLIADSLGAPDELDLVLSLDDFTPVDQSLSQLVKILLSLFKVLIIQWSGNLQVVELLDKSEVNLLVLSLLPSSLLFAFLLLWSSKLLEGFFLLLSL